MSKTLRGDSGATLELKEGVVLDADGNEVRGFVGRNLWRAAPLLLIFAIPASLVLVFFLLGGFFSLVLAVLLFQPVIRLVFPRMTPRGARQ